MEDDVEMTLDGGEFCTEYAYQLSPAAAEGIWNNNDSATM